MDAGLRRELNLMCNLSEYVYEKGEKNGLKRGERRGERRGMKRGMRQGREDTKKDIVKAMIKEGYSRESILKVVRVSPEKYEKWCAESSQITT